MFPAHAHKYMDKRFDFTEVEILLLFVYGFIDPHKNLIFLQERIRS